MWPFGKGQTQAPQVAAAPRKRQPEHNSIHLIGQELERAVQKEVLGNNLEWELPQMQPLLSTLWAYGFTCIMQTYVNGRTIVDVKLGDIRNHSEDHVSEESDIAPCVALARAALSAVRYWPEVLR